MPVSEIPTLPTEGGLRPGIEMPMFAAGVSLYRGSGTCCPVKKVNICASKIPFSAF